MELSVRVLGVLRLALAVLAAFTGAVTLVVSSKLDASLRAMSNAPLVPDAPVSPSEMAAVFWVTGALAMFLLTTALVGAIAGMGLLARRSWARALAIGIAVSDLLLFPLGTAVGVYGLWVLLAPGSRLFFTPTARPR